MSAGEDTIARPRSGIGFDTICVVAGLLLAAVQMGWHERFIHDDAFISLRYARNLVEHGALVWNPGERVEGYTNFLHVVLSAALMAVGVPAVWAARTVNLVGALVLAAATLDLMRSIAPSSPAVRALGGLSIMASPSLAAWVMGGLEAVPEAGMVATYLALLVRILRDGPGPGLLALAAVFGAMALLLRLDAAIIVAAAGLSAATLAGPARMRVALVVVGVPALVSLIHMLARHAYYGEWLPLTFYAKTEVPFAERLERGYEYLRLCWDWTPLVTLGMATLALAAGFHAVPRLLRPVAAALVAQLAYLLWAGGDHMPADRMLIIAVVPAGVCIVGVAARLPARGGVLLAAGMLIVTAVASIKPPLQMDNAARIGSLVGRYIETAWPQGSLVALHTAGSTPFMAPSLRFIDMLGLNDPVIAHRTNVPELALGQGLPGHAKGDGAYVMQRAPDFIIAGPADGITVDRPWFLTDAELARNPQFARCYSAEKREIDPAISAYAAQWPDGSVLKFTYYRRICPRAEPLGGPDKP